MACGAASREPGRPVGIVGHGLRTRVVEGPVAVDEAPVFTEIRARRYGCKACGAILIVLPRGVGRGYRFALAAIALGLALWASGVPSATVRSKVSTSKMVGASSAARWASLRRWVQCAAALFGAVVDAGGTLRERAGRIAAWVASKALVPVGPIALDAFAGAPYCASG